MIILINKVEINIKTNKFNDDYMIHYEQLVLIIFAYQMYCNDCGQKILIRDHNDLINNPSMVHEVFERAELILKDTYSEIQKNRLKR